MSQKTKYYFIIWAIFLVPWIEGLVYGGNRCSNYAAPFMLIAGFFACRKRHKFPKHQRGIQHKVFFVWVCLSLLFSLILYKQKISNILNILSIALVYISVYLFLQKEQWRKFIDALVFFLISFLFLNILIQICLPRSWGEFIFKTQSGLKSTTTNFSYLTISEKISNISDAGPLAIPAFRNHGLAVLTALLTLYALSRLLIYTRIQFKNSNRIVFILLFAVGLVLSFLCDARGVLIGLAVIFFYCIRYVRNKFHFLAFLFTLIFIYLLTCNPKSLLLGISKTLRINDSYVETVSGRAELWDLHKNLIIERPWTGWGRSLPYEKYAYDIENQSTTESGLSFILATQGLMRGGLFLSLLAIGIWRTGCKTVQDWRVLFLHFTCILLIILCATIGILTSVTSAIDSIVQTLLAISLFCVDEAEKNYT